MSFQDKVVIVTGSSSGIGAATAIQFAEEGAKVAIVGRNQEKLNNVAKKCGKPLVLVADVTKDEDARRIINETVKVFGKIDVLVNNAGVAGLFEGIQSAQAMPVFDKLISTNLRSVVYLTHLAVPHLLKTKGNIVNISSIAGLQPLKNLFAYCTSKAGLDHFTRAVALELAASGVRVNVINPGPVVTDILGNTGATKEEQAAAFKKFGENTPLKRVSIPEEIGDLVLFLASDKARGITGSSFVSDNGTLLVGS